MRADSTTDNRAKLSGGRKKFNEKVIENGLPVSGGKIEITDRIELLIFWIQVKYCLLQWQPPVPSDFKIAF